jgi:hypothetical protein
MGLFEYSVTRPLKLGKWGILAFWMIAVFFVVCITLLNVIAVGYDLVIVSTFIKVVVRKPTLVSRIYLLQSNLVVVQ